MKHCYFFIFSFLSSFSLLAQKGVIRGSIASESGSPLSGITMSLQGTQLSAITDDDGVFYFPAVSQGNYIIEATGVGYSAKSQTITVIASKTTSVHFKLDVKANVLQEVIIKSDQRVPKINTASVTRASVPLKDLPQNIQVVDRVILDEQQLFTVDQAIKNVAGVNSASIYGSFYIRGFEIYPGSFLTNGLKGSPYPEGVMPLLGNIESVEVLHGPTAILYGEGALGGNINMVTKQPKKTNTLNASIGAGSFDMFRVMSDVTGSINKKKSLYYVAGVAFQNGGRFTRNFKNQNLQIYGSLRWEASAKTTLQLNTNLVHDNSSSNWQPDVPVFEGIPLFSLPADFTYLASDGNYKGSSYQLQLAVNHSISNNWKANLLVGLSESRAKRKEYSLNWDYNPQTTALSRGYSDQTINSPTRTINPYVSGALKVIGMQHKIVTGLDLTFDRNIYPNGIKSYSADSLYLNAPDYKPGRGITPNPWSSRHELFTYNTVAGYFQDLIEIVPKLKLLAGIRYTNYFRRLYADDENFQPIYDERPENTEAFTPRAGIVYLPFENGSFYFDYNRGFTPQYSNYREFGGPFDPETSHQLEAGFKGIFLNQRLQTTAAFYRINKANVLEYYEDSLLPRGYGYRPLEEVISKGVELSVTGSLAKGLYAIANYSFNETKISKSSNPDQIGKGFYNAPSTNINGWLSYAVQSKGFEGLSLGFGISHIGKRDTYFGSVPKYTVADAMIAYAYKRYKLQVNGNNLFDKTYAQSGGYVSYVAGAPRNFLVTLSYSVR